MENNLDSLKSKINSLPAEFLEMISNYFENLEPKKKFRNLQLSNRRSKRKVRIS